MFVIFSIYHLQVHWTGISTCTLSIKVPNSTRQCEWGHDVPQGKCRSSVKGIALKVPQWDAASSNWQHAFGIILLSRFKSKVSHGILEMYLPPKKTNPLQAMWNSTTILCNETEEGGFNLIWSFCKLSWAKTFYHDKNLTLSTVISARQQILPTGLSVGTMCQTNMLYI